MKKYYTQKQMQLQFTDFTAGASGDIIDYGDLLRNASTSYDGANPFAGGFLNLEQSGEDTLIKFDKDGNEGSESEGITVAILKNVQASSLVADNFNPNFPPLNINIEPPEEIIDKTGAKFGYQLLDENGEVVNHLAVMGSEADKKYTLEITGESLVEDFYLESADITIDFDTSIFNLTKVKSL